MPEAKNIHMTDEQIEAVQKLNIMDVASEQMTKSQAEAIQNLADAKNNTDTDVAYVVGHNDVPSFRFRRPRPIVKDYRIGRNDPCPCGSGLKYKKCCLDSGKYESTHVV